MTAITRVWLCCWNDYSDKFEREWDLSEEILTNAGYAPGSTDIYSSGGL